MMKKTITIVTMYLFYIAQLTPVFADDIEIYQGQGSDVRPNVMFMLDTSGSMNETVHIEGHFYDPNLTYPGPFRNDRLYFFEFPEIEWLDIDWKVFKDILLDNIIHPDSFKCQTQQAQLESKGYAVDKFLQWNPYQEYRIVYWFIFWIVEAANLQGTWQTLKPSDDPNRYVDCGSDAGKHGVDGSSHEKYITHRQHGVPYTSDSSIAVWGL